MSSQKTRYEDLLNFRVENAFVIKEVQEARKYLADLEKKRQTTLLRLSELEEKFGEVCCDHWDDSEGVGCTANTFKNNGQLPEGWAEQQFSCGDGGNGNFFCPEHAEEAEESCGKCDTCGR